MPQLHKAFVAVILIGLATEAAWSEGPGRRPHAAHVHGVAHLTIAAEGTNVLAELVSPAASLVGFEHQPRTDRERETLNMAKTNLQAGDAMIRFNTEADCRLESAAIESALVGEHAHADGDNHRSGNDGHADLHAVYTFVCARPDALGSAALGLFAGFPALERVLVHYVTAEGQGGAELTPGNPIVRFVPL